METTPSNITTNVRLADLSRATKDAVAEAQKEARDYNTFRPYDSALTIPKLEGYRNVKCMYKKNTKTGKVAGENSYIRVEDSISAQVVADNLDKLTPYVIAMLQAEEDKIVKALHVGGADTVHAGSLGLDNVLRSLESSGSSVRLNKEAIEDWFADTMYESLYVAFAGKLGISDQPTEEELAKLEAITATYRAKFGSLASPKTAYRPEEAKMLQKALEITGAVDTAIGGRFQNRLEGMKELKSNNLLLAL